MTVTMILGWLAAIVLIVWLLYRLHHLSIYLEDRGYIYYRTKPRGGGGSVFSEIDKLTRPSIEHVERAMDTEVESQENDGE